MSLISAALVVLLFAYVNGQTTVSYPQFYCYQCTGKLTDCQNEKNQQACPPANAPVEQLGSYRCMIAVNNMDGTVFQGCVSTCKADVSKYYVRNCTTTNFGNCIPGSQCTQNSPPIAGDQVIRSSLTTVLVSLFLSLLPVAIMGLRR